MNIYKNIQLLDCTLRDGGQGLEDNVKNKLADVYFNIKDIEIITNLLAESDIDIVELGCMDPAPGNKKGFSIEHNVVDISKRKPKKHKQDQLFAALYIGPDTPVDDIPEWNPDLVEVVRVILRYSELQKSLDYCAALSQKGYKVFVQPMLTMRYTDDELNHLIEEANNMKAYALYFVDSYGYMNHADVERFFTFYNKKLNPDIRIGFHAHNNMNLAFSNVLHFLNIAGDRNVVVDSACMGMGQGAGNMQTELLAGYFNITLGTSYAYKNILDICEILEGYTNVPLWGYTVTRVLPAIHKTAYKYSVALRNHYGMRYSDIDRVLSQMPEDLRHRYTSDNTIELLKRTGYEEFVAKRKF